MLHINWLIKIDMELKPIEKYIINKQINKYIYAWIITSAWRKSVKWNNIIKEEII